jgi:TPR repeat protein
MNQVVAKLKVIIKNSDIITQTDSFQLSAINLNDIDLLYTNNSSYKELSHQIIQNFEINKEEIGPTTQNIHEVIFEEELGIVIDEIVNIYFEALNKGKEENDRKKCILNYINDCKINLQEIHTWVLSNQNDSNSIYLLGYFNYHGIGIDVDKQKAYELYEKAEKLENIVAQLELANMCIHIYKDYDKAFKLSKKSAAGGNPNAINRLGYCYENGFGTAIKMKKAFELYQKAADLGNSNGINNLGRCYEVGIGININKIKAFELYQKAANLGNSYGIYNLGCSYENGIGINVSVQEAFKFYKKAADLGNSFGLNNLGICYKNGIGTEINMQKAFVSFHKAANLGNYFAQFNLAYMYEGKDINQAINWYKKSAEQGYQYAQFKLEQLLTE